MCPDEARVRFEISPATQTSANRVSICSLTRAVTSDTLGASCGGPRRSTSGMSLMTAGV
jgi:hypothetical protein